jgi:hypothetical protein
MRLSAPLYLFDQKDSSLKVVPLQSDPYSAIPISDQRLE